MRKPTLAQYNVQFPNAPALHAQLTRLLIREKVPLKFMMTVRMGDRTTIQFLAPRSGGLKEKLQAMGIEVRQGQVFQVRLPRHPWELHKLARSLAAEGINIESLYTHVEEDTMRIVMSVDQTANALALFRDLGLDPDYAVYE